MSIMIREDLTDNHSLQVNWNYKESPTKVKQLSESMAIDNPIAADSIMTEYEAIHEGLTRNFTDYTRQGIISSIPTWTTPYLRPLIMHHNEADGKIIGRIHHADYTNKNTLSGTGALILVGNIPDKEGKEAVEDGRLKTVSIGVIVHEAFCSICGKNIAEEGECEHERGVEYDGKVCTWQITKMEAKELSYVIVPSDVYAQHRKIYKANKNNIAKLKESYKGVIDLQENQIIDETVKPETTPVVPVPTEPAEDVQALKDKIEALKTEVEILASTNKVINKELEDEKVLKAAAEKKLSDTQVLLDKANEDIDKVKTDLVAKESALSKEIELREAAESQLMTDKQTKRISLVESVIELRTKLNKRVVTKEDLEKKSDDFLQESLMDLQEELKVATNVTEQITNPSKITNPGIVENNEEKNKTHVKEQKPASNINVEESMTALMSSLLGSKKSF